MEGLVGMVIFLGIIVYVMCSPVNTDSTSYKLGKGIGNKTRKLGKWLMEE